jgi:hypothetical protein
MPVNHPILQDLACKAANTTTTLAAKYDAGFPTLEPAQHRLPKTANVDVTETKTLNAIAKMQTAMDARNAVKRLHEEEGLRPDHVNTRTTATLNQCAFSGYIKGRASKTNGKAPKVGDTAWITRDTRTTKKNCKLPPGVVVAIRSDRSSSSQKLEYKVAINTPRGMVCVEEWLPEHHLLRATDQITAADLDLLGAVGTWSNTNRSEVKEYMFDVLVKGLNPGTRTACKCGVGRGCFLAVGDPKANACPCRKAGAECGSSCHPTVVGCCNTHSTLNATSTVGGCSVQRPTLLSALHVLQ